MGALATFLGSKLVKSVGSKIADFGTQYLANRVNQRNMRDTARYQDMINVKNWKAQNSYNSPHSMMLRLKAAGLNPNLIYQSGGIEAASNIASPEVSNPNMSVSPYSPVSDYVDLTQSENQTRNISQQILQSKATEELLKNQKSLSDIDLKWSDRMKYQSLVNEQMQQALISANIGKLETETGLNKRAIDTYYLRLENTLSNDRVQRELGRQNIEHVKKQIEAINRSLKLTDSQIAINYLTYARGLIAKGVEEFTANWQMQKNKDGKPHLQDYLERQLSILAAEDVMATEEIVQGPIKTLLNAVGLGFLVASHRKPSKPIGFNIKR